MGLFKRRAATAAPRSPSRRPTRLEGLLAEIERLTDGQPRARATARASGGCCGSATSPACGCSSAARPPSTPRPTSPPARRRRPARRSRPRELTPELLRAGILRDGCLLVRGLVDREAALALAGADRPRVRRARRSRRGVRRRRATTRSSSPSRASRSPGAAVDPATAAACWPATRRSWRSRCSSCSRRAGPAAAGRRLPRRAAAAVGAQDDAAQGRPVPSAAPGTRTARSWATCAR